MYKNKNGVSSKVFLIRGQFIMQEFEAYVTHHSD